jgi:hypothetical protein
MMEARTVAAQANAVSAEQRAKLAERERDELSEQLAMARQLINSRESAPTGRAAAGSPTRWLPHTDSQPRVATCNTILSTSHSNWKFS